MAVLQEVKFKNEANVNFVVHSTKKDLFEMYRGQEVVLTRKCTRLVIVISGEFEAFQKEDEKRNNFSYRHAGVFYGENIHLFCLADNSAILVIEFDFDCDSSEFTRVLKNKNLSHYFIGLDWEQIKLFLEEAKGLEGNSNLLSQWVSLLIFKIRQRYLDSYKNIIGNVNGAVFYGYAPSYPKDFEISITDAILVVTNDETGEKQTINFSCKNYFCEQELTSSIATDTFEGNRSIDYYNMKMEQNQYFKVWFFPENQCEKLNISPFTHSLRFSYSIKANAPCEVCTGISNITDYERVCDEVKVAGDGCWEDFLISLFGSDCTDKANYYIKNIVQYIEKNYQKKITVTDLAKMVHLHPNYLSRVFKGYMGCSVPQYITNLRIHEAKKLLGETTRTVEGIAAEVGFYDSHHLQKTFKLATGQTPIEYRNGKAFL